MFWNTVYCIIELCLVTALYLGGLMDNGYTSYGYLKQCYYLLPRCCVPPAKGYSQKNLLSDSKLFPLQVVLFNGENISSVSEWSSFEVRPFNLVKSIWKSKSPVEHLYITVFWTSRIFKFLVPIISLTLPLSLSLPFKCDVFVFENIYWIQKWENPSI